MIKKREFKQKKEKKPFSNTKQVKKLLKLPHISRFFTARVLYNLFILFLSVGTLGIVAFNFLYPSDKFEMAKINLFLKPYDSKSYLALSDIYLGYNDYEKAKRELNNAIFFSNDQFEKTEITKKILMIERAEKSRGEIEVEISKWEKISKEKSNYRDAFFRLAVLNYQIYKNTAAKEYLNQAMALDPNFEEGKRLAGLL